MDEYNSRIRWDDLEVLRSEFIRILNSYFDGSVYVAKPTSAKNEFRINIESNEGILISMWPKKRDESFDFWIHTEIYDQYGKREVLPQQEVFIRESLTGWKKYRNVYPDKIFEIIESLDGVAGEDVDLYWPLLKDYDPNITTEQYIDLLRDTDVIPLSYWETPYMIYKYGGEATCKNLEKRFGKKKDHYNRTSTNLAKKVHSVTQCSLYEDRKYWTILYRGKPAESKDDGSWIWRLRDPLWQAIEKLDEEDYFLDAFDEASEELNMDVKHDLNTILYGPPGTGKTYHTVIYAVAIIENKSIDDISSESYDDIKARFDEYKKNGQIVFTTFHQSFGYEEFIEGIKPTVGLDSDNISYRIEDGLFKRLCKKAAASEQVENPYVMIIDEINRGNISKIFGELITLIEDTKRDGCAEATTVTLPYSGENFSIPSNVYLLGTMNTADRSIALMDTALRRRFSFVEMMPDPEVLKNNDAYIVRDGNKVLDVALMLDVINQRIEYLFDREHTIGHAFFMPLKDNPTVNQLAIIFKKKIIPLLQEYFYEDYEKIQLVLGDNKKSDEKYCFITNARQTASSIFNGNPELDQVAKYSINNDALKHIESYIEIIRNSSVT